MNATFIHSAQLEQYSYPPECPFKTERAGMAYRTLMSMGLLNGAGRTVAPPQQPDRAAVERFHSSRYLDIIDAAAHGHLDVEGLHMGLGTPDTPIFKGVYEYAMLACAATLTAARLVLDGTTHIAFNPSGGYHHAHYERAGGFCYVNDVGVACTELANEGKRVLFLDVDAHHGDGVQAGFYDRRDVMTISFHENGRTLFPGTGWENEIGVGEGEGFAVNIPLPPDVFDEVFVWAFLEVALPLTKRFDPDVILLELGMDGLAGDPLTHMSLTNNAYADVISLTMSLGKPIVATGGGGYNSANAARGWALAWSVLCGADVGRDGLNPGLGGVLLESTDWQGGLRDRELPPDPEQRAAVEPAVTATVETVKANVFPIHGLTT